MSFRGGGRGGRGGGRGGWPGGGGSNMPPMGLTREDLALMSKEPAELYPTLESPAIPPEPASILAMTCVSHLLSRKLSPFYVHTARQKDPLGLPKYSDQYQPVAPSSSASLRQCKSIMSKDLFPPSLWEAVMEPELLAKRRRQTKRTEARKRAKLLKPKDILLAAEESGSGSDGEADKRSGDDNSDVANDDPEDEEEDDYAGNYFDNGEEDGDGLGEADGPAGGGGDDDY